MELKDLVSKCYDALVEDNRDSIAAGDDSAVATVNTDDGYIDMCCDTESDISVLVYHDCNEREHSNTNIETFLTMRLAERVDWWGIEEDMKEEEIEYDIWNEHGFASAADYWSYRLG